MFCSSEVNPPCEQVKEKTRTTTPIGAEGVPRMLTSSHGENLRKRTRGGLPQLDKEHLPKPTGHHI